MDLKIYQPYFMSNSTIIQFEKKKKGALVPEKVSMIKILESHFLQKQSHSRLYFKVNLRDDPFCKDPKEAVNETIKMEQLNSIYSSVKCKKVIKERQEYEEKSSSSQGVDQNSRDCSIEL